MNRPTIHTGHLIQFKVRNVCGMQLIVFNVEALFEDLQTSKYCILLHTEK